MVHFLSGGLIDTGYFFWLFRSHALIFLVSHDLDLQRGQVSGFFVDVGNHSWSHRIHNSFLIVSVIGIAPF